MAATSSASTPALTSPGRRWPSRAGPSVHADHDAGRLDDRVGVHAGLEPQALGRSLGYHRDDLLATGQLQDDLRVDRSVVYADDLPLQHVARAYLHRHHLR